MMNLLSNNKEFYRDLFIGELKPMSSERMVQEMVRARKQRKRLQTAGLISLASLIMLGMVLLRQPAPVKLSWKTHASEPSWHVRSRSFGGIVRTEPMEGLVFSTAPGEIAVIRSEPSGGPLEISDEQLLKLFEGQSLALLRNHGQAMLEFLDAPE